MKKYISIMLLVALAISGTAFAGGDHGIDATATVDVYDLSKDDYSTETVPIVSLMFGKDDILTTDVPAFILNGRTLVPIRFIVDTLDADVEWNQEDRQAVIHKDGKEIILTIDSSEAIVDGKKVQLPDGVPAKLVSYKESARTVVPFRFISEQLGMEIEWIPDTYTAVIDYPHRSISDVKNTTYNGVPAIAIKADGKINYNSMYLPAIKLGMTDQLVVDIPNTDLGSRNYLSGSINKNGIIGYRASLYETSPRDVVRVTVELEMQSRYETHYDKETDTLYLTFNNQVENISYERNSQAVVIKTEETPIYNVIDLGDRVAVDIFDSVLNVRGDEIDIHNDVINTVRYAQYDSDYPEYDKVTRVVFELQRGINFSENMYIDDINNDIIAYTTTDPMNQLKYEHPTLASSVLTLELNNEGRSNITNDDVNKIMTIKLDKDQINLLDDVQLDYYDNIIKYIEIDGDSERGYYILTIKYDSETTAQVITGNTTSREVAIQFTGKESNIITNPIYGNVLIVLDPGHGGKDSGAYYGGVTEKYLNLDTSLKLKDLLEEAGFKVAMTRSDDSYPGLYERAALANALKADLFLSVHHNALPSNPAAQGVLTVYDGNSASKTQFAQTIQREMVKGLPVPDKGLQNRPKIVVTRETNMPSALAELGFMTNDYERSLLVQDYYRQRCAQALFNGIKSYVDGNLLK